MSLGKDDPQMRLLHQNVAQKHSKQVTSWANYFSWYTSLFVCKNLHMQPTLLEKRVIQKSSQSQRNIAGPLEKFIDSMGFTDELILMQRILRFLLNVYRNLHFLCIFGRPLAWA